MQLHIYIVYTVASIKINGQSDAVAGYCFLFFLIAGGFEYFSISVQSCPVRAFLWMWLGMSYVYTCHQLCILARD